MNDQSGQERAAAAREARDAAASRPATSGSIAREAALRRFLGAETYREKRIEESSNGGAERGRTEEGEP